MIQNLFSIAFSFSWGNSLVIVAHQEVRKLILTNPDYNPLTELGILQYCVLERIGRSRYHGELTQGKLGLQLISEDPKLLFYYRKHLFKQKLITKQVCYSAPNFFLFTDVSYMNVKL